MRALILAAVFLTGCSTMIVERNVSVPMRDGVVLRADIYRPRGGERFPVLVYRTPYGKREAAEDYRTHLEAVKREYVVVLQDVRGRYESDGIFNPYRNEGADGYDTIEWAARQAWSNGKVGTYGLSYPGAVQWLAAMEQPAHLQAMVPAMTFSSPRNFFYMNGVFDTSWLPWIYTTVAPDARRRLGMPPDDRPWADVAQEYRSWLPLRDLPYLRREAPFYFEWLAHPPADPWWDWAELRGRYSKVSVPVLNLSGWYDEAYGPEGAVTNFNGLAKSNLIIGPWVHGVAATESRITGSIDFGPEAAIDYDDVVLDFLDHHLRGIENDLPPVRYFVMGANEWRSDRSWPPTGTTSVPIYFADAGHSEFIADPLKPVTDPYVELGPHDYQALNALTFDTEPLAADLTIAGAIVAEIHVSCDCRDFDLWVRVLDVYPDGRAFNLMSPGNDVVRASYQHGLVEPGRVYQVRLPTLLTSNRFAKGHRIRTQISASFAPHLSRNLQSGESEVSGKKAMPARIRIHHGGDTASRLLLPSVR
jgi:predicted acyl esterase